MLPDSENGANRSVLQGIIARDKVAAMTTYLLNDGIPLFTDAPKYYLSNLGDLAEVAREFEIGDTPRDLLLTFMTNHMIDFTLCYWPIHPDNRGSLLPSLFEKTIITTAELIRTPDNIEFVITHGWVKTIKEYLKKNPQDLIDLNMRFPLENVVTKAVLQRSEILARQAFKTCKSIMENDRNPQILPFMGPLHHNLDLIVGGL